VSCEDTEKHRDTHSDLCDNFGHTFEGVACDGERMVVNGTRKSRPHGIARGPRLDGVRKIGGGAEIRNPELSGWKEAMKSGEK